MNANGFLQRAPHGLRLSGSQKRAVQRAVDSVLHHARQKNSDALNTLTLDLCKKVFGSALAGYPEDRSCHSCINFDPSDGSCSSWKATVPNEARDAGCDRYLEDIPF